MSRTAHRSCRTGAPLRRGSVIVVVLWMMGIAALVASSVQLFAYRQGSLGRETLHRIQARWAARAGVENTIAVMADFTDREVGLAEDAFALVRDMGAVSYGELLDSSYDIVHDVDFRRWNGPFDEHARLNINGADPALLEVLDDITPDVVAAIVDWMDEDDDVATLGAERDHYLAMSPPYEPRNGPMRSIAELELVAGIWADYVRGEDWNLNNRKEPNESDGARTLPEDDPDGYFDKRWSNLLTARSYANGATLSGLPRLYLRRAEPAELMARFELTQAQAERLIAYGRNEDNRISQLAIVPLDLIDASGTPGANSDPSIAPLTDDQLRLILNETMMEPPYERLPGKININSASPFFIRDLLEIAGLDPAVADELIYLRDSRAEGITSTLDFRQIPEMDDDTFQRLVDIFDVVSNVFTVTVKGRSVPSGIEVEIIAVVDRSSLPIRILEYREQ